MRQLLLGIEFLKLLAGDKRVHPGPSLRVAKHQETQNSRHRVSDEYDKVIDSSHNALIFSRSMNESGKNRLAYNEKR